MEIVATSERIDEKVSLLAQMRNEMKPRAQEKAQSISDYEKAFAITVIQLKNGVPFTLDGETIKDPPTTIIEKIAKGICYESKLKMELADGAYKSLITNIETVKAELNGLQSINKHLE